MLAATVIAWGMSLDVVRTDSNQELRAQGIGNLLCRAMT